MSDVPYFRVNHIAFHGLGTRSAIWPGHPPLECDVEWPTAPNPPREVELLLDDDVPVELDELRVPLDGLERNAVVGAVVELRRERS
jgi:hypothetical protein